MLEIILFYLFFICITCVDSDVENKESLIMEKNDNSLKQQTLSSNDLEHKFDKNEYQKLKNEYENIYFFEESYENATKYIEILFNKFISLEKDNSSYFVFENFMNFLLENLYIDKNNEKFLYNLLSYDYLEFYFSLFKNLLQCSKNKQIFKDILNLKDLENDIDLGFYKLTKLFNQFPKKKTSKFYFKKMISLILFYNKNLKEFEKTNNISEIMSNSIVSYLFTPYFLSNYIYHKFVESYLNDILVFFEKNPNETMKKSKYLFHVENLENDEYFFTLKNKSKKIILALKIKKIENDINSTENSFSLIELRVIYTAEDNINFNKLPLLTKNNLNSIFKKDCELSKSLNIENEENTIN